MSDDREGYHKRIAASLAGSLEVFRDSERIVALAAEAEQEVARRIRQAEATSLLREIRRLCIASVRGEEYAESLSDEYLDEYQSSTPIDVENIIARMKAAEAEVNRLREEILRASGKDETQ